LLGEITVEEWLHIYGYIFINYVRYLGYVKNIGNKEAKDVRIFIRTYNSNNELIGSDSASIGNLDPGNVRGVNVVSSLGINEYHHYEYQIIWRED